MTNYDRFMKCTPEQLTSVFYNLKENAIIEMFREDIYYEGSNFWRNHASFKNT